MQWSNTVVCSFACIILLNTSHRYETAIKLNSRKNSIHSASMRTVDHWLWHYCEYLRTSLVFILWRYYKSKVYANKPKTFGENLKANTWWIEIKCMMNWRHCDEIAVINAFILKNVAKTVQYLQNLYCLLNLNT